MKFQYKTPMCSFSKIQYQIIIDLHFFYLNFNSQSVGFLHLQNLKSVITVPANGLAPNGARPFAGTAMSTKLFMIYSKKLWIIFFINFPDQTVLIIQITGEIWLKPWGTVRVNICAPCPLSAHQYEGWYFEYPVKQEAGRPGMNQPSEVTILTWC